MQDQFELNEEDERAVAAFMARVAALPTEWRMPEMAQVWWKGQLMRRWDAERRAQLPLDVMDIVQIAGAVAAAALLVTWSIPSALRLLAIG